MPRGENIAIVGLRLLVPSFVMRVPNRLMRKGLKTSVTSHLITS